MSRRIAEPHGPPAIAAILLATENQSENKTDTERGENRLGRIFAHVFFGILLESADADRASFQASSPCRERLQGSSALPISAGDRAWADFESSAALRAWVLLLSSLLCVSLVPLDVIFSSAIYLSPVGFFQFRRVSFLGKRSGENLTSLGIRN